jgi:hypothetical protein
MGFEWFFSGDSGATGSAEPRRGGGLPKSQTTRIYGRVRQRASALARVQRAFQGYWINRARRRIGDCQLCSAKTSSEAKFR